MQSSHKISNNSFSFLDLLFGSLGAVVLLLIITLSFSGPPPKIRDQAERTIEWNIVTSQEGINDFQIFLLPEKKNLFSGTFNGETYAPQSKQEISYFSFDAKKIIEPNASQIIYSFLLTYGGDDGDWNPLAFLLLIKGTTNFTIYKANVAVLPGTNEARCEIGIPKERKNNQFCFESEFELKDEDDGKMPVVKTFKMESETVIVQ
jgi:hypothetical protein